MIVLEIFMLMIGHDRRRERPEPLAMLDAGVENVLHVGQAGMRNDRAIAQRTRAPFHPALKPADHIAGGDLVGHLVE